MEVQNTDIKEIKSFKLKIRTVIKTLPYCDNLKPALLSEIDKIHLPLYKYQRSTKEVTASAFKGMVVARVDTVLTDNHINPLIIDKVKDIVKKAEL